VFDPTRFPAMREDGLGMLIRSRRAAQRGGGERGDRRATVRRSTAPTAGAIAGSVGSRAGAVPRLKPCVLRAVGGSRSHPGLLHRAGRSSSDWPHRKWRAATRAGPARKAGRPRSRLLHALPDTAPDRGVPRRAEGRRGSPGRQLEQRLRSSRSPTLGSGRPSLSLISSLIHGSEWSGALRDRIVAVESQLRPPAEVNLVREVDNLAGLPGNPDGVKSLPCRMD
jgi:hypothetical protein